MLGTVYETACFKHCSRALLGTVSNTVLGVVLGVVLGTARFRNYSGTLVGFGLGAVLGAVSRTIVGVVLGASLGFGLGAI